MLLKPRNATVRRKQADLGRESLDEISRPSAEDRPQPDVCVESTNERSVTTSLFLPQPPVDLVDERILAQTLPTHPGLKGFVGTPETQPGPPLRAGGTPGRGTRRILPDPALRPAKPRGQSMISGATSTGKRTERAMKQR